MSTTREQQYFDALKRIASYDPPERLRRRHWQDWGLDDPNEAIEMAYENVIHEAKIAIKRRRRPQGTG